MNTDERGPACPECGGGVTGPHEPWCSQRRRSTGPRGPWGGDSQLGPAHLPWELEMARPVTIWNFM